MAKFKSVNFRMICGWSEDKEIPYASTLEIEFENESECNTFLKKDPFFIVNEKPFVFRRDRNNYLAIAYLPLAKGSNDIEPSVKEAAIKWLRTKYPEAYNYEDINDTAQEPSNPKKEDTIITNDAVPQEEQIPPQKPQVVFDEKKIEDLKKLQKILDNIKNLKEEAIKKQQQSEAESRKRGLTLDQEAENLRVRFLLEAQKRQEVLNKKKQENEERSLKVQSDLRKYQDALNQPLGSVDDPFPSVNRVFPQTPDDKQKKPELPTENTAYASFSLLTVYANDDGSSGNYITSKINGLKSNIDFTFDVATLSFSNEQFTKEAQNDLSEILLNYAKKSFTFTKLKIAENILDKKTHDKINAILERNRQFSNRKINILWFAFFIGIIATTFSMSSLFYISVSSIGVYFYNKLKTRFIDYTDMTLKIELSLTLFSLAALSLAYLGPLACGITLFTGIGGLWINRYRDQFVKDAITKYNTPGQELNDVERDSFKNGFDAQKSFVPVFYYRRSTWDCPEAYYAGNYSPEIILENKIRA